MKRVKLEDVAEILGGGTPKTKVEEYWNGDVVWLSPTDLPEIGEITTIYDSARKITETGLKNSAAKLLPTGTVIFSSRASIGKIGINEVPVATNQGFVNFICGDDLYNKYLAYTLKYFTNEIVELSNSTTFKEVSRTAIRKFKIPLPSLDEQKAIVAKLDRAQRLIDIDREMLAKYDELIQSIFLDMFGDPVLNKVEDSNVVELSELVKIVGGGTPSKKKPEYWNGSIPWVSPKDMKRNLIFESKDKITEDAINQSSAKLINRGAVLAVVRSGILKKRWPLAINKIDVALNQDMKAFICKKSINNYFLLYYLKLYSRKILNSVRGTTADNISSTAIKKIPVRVPELVKQEKFMRMVQCIESEKQGIDVSIREKLFTSLLHKKLQVYDRAMQN